MDIKIFVNIVRGGVSFVLVVNLYKIRQQLQVSPQLSRTGVAGNGGREGLNFRKQLPSNGHLDILQCQKIRSLL
jgi:hypothetical protein